VLVEEVGLLFRQWADEGDETFMTKADVTVYLRQGYRRFRQVVRRIVPEFYSTSVVITMAGDTYDLSAGAVIILGGGVLTHTRLASLIKVESVDSAGAWLDDWSGAQDWNEIRFHDHSYLLAGTTLQLSASRTGDLRLRYVPVDNVAWANNESSDANTFIDDAEEHHALIATYAYGFYAPRDFAENPFLLQLKRDQERDLRAWLYKRVAEQGDHVAFDP